MTQIKDIPFINYLGEVTTNPKELILNDEIEVSDVYLNDIYKIGQINKITKHLAQKKDMNH